MKLPLALLAVFAALGTHQIHGVPVPTRGLPQDLQDLLDLVPVDEVTDLFLEYLSYDEDFGEAIDYVLSDDFKKLVITVEAMPEVKSLLTYLQESGLDVYEMANKLHDLLGIDRVNSVRRYKITGGLPGFIKDVEAILPVKEIQELYEKKLQTSEEFAALINKLKSPEFQGLVDHVMANPELQKVINHAEAKGVDVQAIFDFLGTILGLKFPHRPTFYLTRNLKDDLNDFLELVPVDDIQDLFFEYLSEDEDFGEALDYVLSNEFKHLLIDIESMSEVRELLNFLEESGLAAYEFINTINDLLGIDRISPHSNYKVIKITGGLPGFIEDVKALLPVAKIEALYKKKLETSEDFATLVQRLMSKEFQGLVDRIMANPRLKDLMERAEAKGVDVQAILDFITSLLGINFPAQHTFLLTRNLKNDLDELLALVPVEALEDLFNEYLSNDEDFGDALDYVLSNEFTGLVIEVEALPEVKSLLEFLVESGLDAYGFLNKLNAFLGIDHITPKRLLNSKKITGGLPGFIADAKALLPLEKIEALYKEKLQTSEDLKKLVSRLSSSEFQTLADNLLANPSLQNLIKRAEAKGVDVQEIFDFLTTLFGLKFPARPRVFLTRNLKNDLDELLALVPVEALEDLFNEYLSNDEDFGDALDYVLSNEFTGLVIEVEALPEVKRLLEFLVESGLDAYGFLNKLNAFLGIDHITPKRLLNSKKITGGLPGFIADAKALLPLEKIEALYKEKLQTSEDLKKLVSRLSSSEFQTLADNLLANPSLQNLIKRAEAKGVDVQEIFDFLTTLFGLKFPARPRVFLTRNLKNDLDELLALVPVEALEDLINEYLSNDEDFGDALDYVLSNEFTGLVIEVEALPEVKRLLEFLVESGLDAYGFLNKLNAFLGIDHITPKRLLNSKKITGGLPGFIADAKALLPLEKIEALYKEKLQTSEDLKKLVSRLSSSEFQTLADNLLANPSLQNLIKRAEAKGVDVQEIFDFLTTLFGLKFPARPRVFLTRNLKNDLDELLDLVPLEALEDLFYEYLSSDEDFGDTLDYVLSNEFTGLVIEVEALPEVKSLLEFFVASGLDAYGFLNKLNAFLGIDHITPKRLLNSKKITGGLPGFIADAKALLPSEKIEALYKEKLQTSEDLKKLVSRLSSSEFQTLADNLLANPSLQNLIKRAEAKGVDVQEIFDFLTTLFGIKFPPRPVVFRLYRNDEVVDILEKIWSMVPVDDIMDVVFDYMLEDQDFKKVMQYMLSDEFRNNLSEIEDLKEMRDVLQFLSDTGVKVYNYINELNELLGVDNHLPGTRNLKITGGVTGLFKDIWAKLPREELWDLWDEKMASSKAFKDFITRLETKELQYLINRLNKHAGYLNMVARLEKLGVDWVEVRKLINTVIGIKFPPRPL